MNQSFFHLVLSCLLGFGIVGLSACTLSSPEASKKLPDNVIRLNLGNEPPSLDPIKMVDLTSFNVAQNLMRGLTTFDENQRVIPAVAKRWEISDDGTTYRFHLRKEAKWSDGRSVLAQDFVDGWKRALSAENGSQYAFFLFPIKNAEAYFKQDIPNFSQVGVRAVTPHTLDVELEEPIAFFLSMLASPVALPIREDLLQEFGNQFTEAGNFLSNGPFILKEWQHENRILLEPNPHYWSPNTCLKQAELLMINDANTSSVMYENGELDYIESPTSISNFDVRRLKKRPEANTKELNVIYYMGYNTQKAPFDDVRVRQAFAYAIDRSYFPRLMQSGQKPESSFLSPGLEGYNPDLGLHFNPKKAKDLLAKAGYPDGKGFPEVELAFRSKYEQRREAEILQYLWKKHLGVTVRLLNMDWKVFLSRLKEDAPHIYRLTWYVDYPDADSFLSLFSSQNGNNFTRWSSPRYDQLVKQGARQSDWAIRQRLYDEAQTILLEKDTAVVPLYVGKKLWLLNPKVTGLVVNGMNMILLDQACKNP